MKKIEEKLKDEYILLCIDPSLKCTGYSLLKVNNELPYNVNDKHVELLNYGIIPTHTLEHGKALMYFEKVITQEIETYNPDYVCSEAPFAGRNRDTIQKLAHIHGIQQLICAKHNLNICYYSVMTAKSKTLNGIKTKNADGSKKTGDQMKKEVSDKIIEIFGKDAFFKEFNFDVTDSISMGITFIKMDGKEIEKAKKKKTKKKG